MKNRILTLALIALLPFTASADCVSTLIGSGINPLASQNICTIQGDQSINGNLVVLGEMEIRSGASNVGDINSGVDGTTTSGRVRISGGNNGGSVAQGAILNVFSTTAGGSIRMTPGTGGTTIIASTSDVPVATFNNGGLDITGELSISGTPTASGVLCRKADGDIGQCTSVVAAGGTCTCG